MSWRLRRKGTGKMAVVGRLVRALLGRVFPSADRCPVCGSKAVKSRVRRPLVMVDGPTYLEMKCGKCGHRWRMLLRAGP